MPNHVVAIPKWRALSYGGVTEDLEEEGAAMAEIRCTTSGRRPLCARGIRHPHTPRHRNRDLGQYFGRQIVKLSAPSF